MSFEDGEINSREQATLGFEEAGSFEELYDMIRAHGDIQGTGKTYTVENLINIIDQVRSGDYMIGYVTRSYKLRETVERLLELDNDKNSDAKNE
jgi:hypothetical protein